MRKKYRVAFTTYNTLQCTDDWSTDHTARSIHNTASYCFRMRPGWSRRNWTQYPQKTHTTQGTSKAGWTTVPLAFRVEERNVHAPVLAPSLKKHGRNFVDHVNKKISNLICFPNISSSLLKNWCNFFWWRIDFFRTNNYLTIRRSSNPLFPRGIQEILVRSHSLHSVSL